MVSAGFGDSLRCDMTEPWTGEPSVTAPALNVNGITIASTLTELWYTHFPVQCMMTLSSLSGTELWKMNHKLSEILIYGH